MRLLCFLAALFSAWQDELKQFPEALQRCTDARVAEAAARAMTDEERADMSAYTVVHDCAQARRGDEEEPAGTAAGGEGDGEGEGEGEGEDAAAGRKRKRGGG